MDEKNREQHEKTKKILKIVGVSLLVVGVIFAAVGFIDFFSAFGSNGMPTKFWCLFIGLPLLGIGGGITLFAYKREISRYVKNESVPVANEASEDLSPAVRNIASAVKEGLSSDDGVRCACGEFNAAGSKFCKKCGKSLASVCPVCGERIEPESAFCNHCGAKLR